MIMLLGSYYFYWEGGPEFLLVAKEGSFFSVDEMGSDFLGWKHIHYLFEGLFFHREWGVNISSVGKDGNQNILPQAINGTSIF